MNVEVSDLVNISKGCQLCQQGKWLCIFITYECNAQCHFCPSPFKNDRIHSAFGNKKDEILRYLINNDFEGISFSGGDPFVVFDRLMEWLLFFKKKLPNYYYWVYTNGLNVDEQKLKLLSEGGMDEIRFNIAATGYSSNIILDKIKIARKYFKYVAVEIPSIKQDFEILQGVMKKLNDIGIDYLNLHDYILSETDLRCTNESYGIFNLNKIFPLKFSYSSVSNTNELIFITKENRYGFNINHCSMEKKEQQMMQRRLKFGRLFSDSEYDIILNDGTINNYYRVPHQLIRKINNLNLINEEKLEALRLYLLKVNELNFIQSSKFDILIASYIPIIEIGGIKSLYKVELI
jgi:pyruvate formate-lyase activating enzyme-like uncharacterized protein